MADVTTICVQSTLIDFRPVSVMQMRTTVISRLCTLTVSRRAVASPSPTKSARLTRSLADFAKLVELFDQHSVSFVSITQSFNTTTSMGRLTFNVLLSFAQFEREVINCPELLSLESILGL
jgi:hypothetical protein